MGRDAAAFLSCEGRRCAGFKGGGGAVGLLGERADAGREEGGQETALWAPSFWGGEDKAGKALKGAT